MSTTDEVARKKTISSDALFKCTLFRHRHDKVIYKYTGSFSGMHSKECVDKYICKSIVEHPLLCEFRKCMHLIAHRTVLVEKEKFWRKSERYVDIILTFTSQKYFSFERKQNLGTHSYATISNTNARQIPKSCVSHRSIPHPAKTKAE